MNFKQFDLYGKQLFIKGSLPTPFKMVAEMESDACFYYVMKGETTVYSRTGKFDRKEGEGLLMECGSYVNVFHDNEEGCYEAIGVHFYSDVIKKIYESEVPGFLNKLDEVEPVHMENVSAGKLMANYIKSLEFYFDNEELVSEELLALKMKELLLLLAKTDQLDGIKSFLSGLFKPSQLDIKAVVENNCYNDLSIEELATLCNMSLSSFKRKFTEIYSESPATYIRKRKLTKSKDLLTNTDLRIEEVAYDCGFNSISHFSKLFKKEYNLAPTEYRLG